MIKKCPMVEGACPKKLEYNPKAGFLMMSYKEEQLLDVEDTIKGFFEERGYKIFVAKDEPKLSSLFCKICGLIQCCGFGICILSDPRPNIFLELGLCFGLGKQVIILGKEGLELPSNISNMEYHTFRTLRDLNTKLEKIEEKLIIGKKPDQDPYEMIILRKAMQLLSDLFDKAGISNDAIDVDEHREPVISNTKKVDNLIDFIDQKIGNVSNPSRYYLSRGKYLFNIRDYDRAFFCYRKVLEDDPDDISALLSTGALHYYQGNLDEAIKYYERAIDAEEDFACPYNNLGIIHDDREEYGKAIECYEKAISLDPEYPNPYNNIGSIFTFKQEYEIACGWYLKALKIDSNFCIARLNLIENYLLLRKLDEARQEINILLKNRRIKSEDRYLAYFFSIFLFLLEKNTEKAGKDLENFIRYYEKHGKVEVEWLFEDIQPLIENLNKKEKELMYGFVSILQGSNDLKGFEHLSEPFRN